jgi:hypothetical protein
VWVERALKTCAWIAAVAVARDFGVAPLVVLLGCFYALWSALETRDPPPGAASGYSVFNRGFERLPGDLRSDDLLRQMHLAR